MADENKPSDKIDLASTELKIGGVNLKGSYIVWFLAIIGSVTGSIMLLGGEWEKYQRVKEFVTGYRSPDLEPLVKLSEQVRQIEDTLPNFSQSIADLQSAQARVSSDIQSITKLMEANDVSKLQGSISQLRTTVEGVSVFTRDVQSLREQMVGVQKDMAGLKKDVDSQWNAIDSIGAGALKGK